MPYKIHKLINDRRNNTHGIFLPNGGFYHVVEMTFENHRQLENLSKRPGYSVDFVDGPIGFFDGEGYPVDVATVEVHPINKQVISYQKKKRTYRGKEVSKKAEHEDSERKQIEQKAARLGIKETQWASTQMLKELIDRSKKNPQRSLAQSLS